VASDVSPAVLFIVTFLAAIRFWFVLGPCYVGNKVRCIIDT